MVETRVFGVKVVCLVVVRFMLLVWQDMYLGKIWISRQLCMAKLIPRHIYNQHSLSDIDMMIEKSF